MSQGITTDQFNSNQLKAICDGCFNSSQVIMVQIVPKYDLIAIGKIGNQPTSISSPTSTASIGIPINSLTRQLNLCINCLTKLGLMK